MGLADRIRAVTAPLPDALVMNELVPRLARSWCVRSKVGAADFPLLAPPGPQQPWIAPTFETPALAMEFAGEWGSLNGGNFVNPQEGIAVMPTASFGVVRLLKATRHEHGHRFEVGDIAVGLITSTIDVPGAEGRPILWTMPKKAVSAARALYGGASAD